MSHEPTETNPKARAAAAIWGCAVGMLIYTSLPKAPKSLPTTEMGEP